MSTPYVAPLRDIDIVLNHVCDLERLATIPRFAHAEPGLVRDLLAEAGRFMAEQIAPLNQSGDQAGSTRRDDGTVTTPAGFAEAYAAYVEGGWGAVPFDEGFGGGGFPWVVGIALQEILTSANMAFSMCPLLTQGAIDAIAHHGSEVQKMTYLPKMVSGEWTGTMNLTEPEAGSDVGAVRTRAERQDDGTYRIFGTKIFITFGEHDLAENIVHLVLARTPGSPPGTKGISLFIVPQRLVNPDGTLGERNDITCVSIEHKMGITASPTCVLSYGDHGGAIGELVGEECRGMAYMFTMMNQARLSVGLEGLAVAERAYQQALAYAVERRQGRAPGAAPGESSPIIDHPDVKRMLATMKATIEGMRRLIYRNAEAIDLSQHALDPDERDRAAELAALLTPLSKSWCTDMGVELCGLAVQLHGGMGYIEETGVAQHYRDVRITTIYEGTNGIQAIDLVGRKVPMRGGAVVAALLDDLGATAASLSGRPELAASQAALEHALLRTRAATTWLLERAGEPVDVLAGATPYLRLLATTVAAGYLVQGALAALDQLERGAGDAELWRSKIATTRFFCEQLLPPAVGQADATMAGAEALMGFDEVALRD